MVRSSNRGTRKDVSISDLQLRSGSPGIRSMEDSLGPSVASEHPYGIAPRRYSEDDLSQKDGQGKKERISGDAKRGKNATALASKQDSVDAGRGQEDATQAAGLGEAGEAEGSGRASSAASRDSAYTEESYYVALDRTRTEDGLNEEVSVVQQDEGSDGDFGLLNDEEFFSLVNKMGLVDLDAVDEGATPSKEQIDARLNSWFTSDPRRAGLEEAHRRRLLDAICEQFFKRLGTS